MSGVGGLEKKKEYVNVTTPQFPCQDERRDVNTSALTLRNTHPHPERLSLITFGFFFFSPFELQQP